MKRFFIREKEVQEAIQSRVQEWTIRKDLREEMETMTELQTIQKRRAKAMQARAKWVWLYLHMKFEAEKTDVQVNNWSSDRL